MKIETRHGIVLLLLSLVVAGTGAAEMPNYPVRGTDTPVNVDGVLDESSWKDATVIPLKYEYRPGDNIPAIVSTDVMITFDHDYLYVAFRAEDPEPGKIRAHLMDRDQIDTFIQDDHVVLMIDTFNDERRGFQFRVNHPRRPGRCDLLGDRRHRGLFVGPDLGLGREDHRRSAISSRSASR